MSRSYKKNNDTREIILSYKYFIKVKKKLLKTTQSCTFSPKVAGCILIFSLVEYPITFCFVSHRSRTATREPHDRVFYDVFRFLLNIHRVLVYQRPSVGVTGWSAQRTDVRIAALGGYFVRGHHSSCRRRRNAPRDRRNSHEWNRYGI